MTVSTLKKKVSCSYEEALERVPEALKTEGFGVLTRIDIQSTLKQKLNVDFNKYTILGACNPPLAHQALCADLEIGLLLPCNVVVYEDQAGDVIVQAVDPTKTIAQVDVEGVQEVAEAVKEKLRRVLDVLS